MESGWSRYFNLLIYFGIIPISLNEAGRVVSTPYDKKMYLIIFLTLSIVNPLFLVNCALYYWSHYYYDYRSITGGSYEFCQEIISALVMSVLLCWMFMNSQVNITSIRQILELDEQTRSYAYKLEPNYSVRYYRIHMICIIVTILNSVSTLAATHPFHFVQGLQTIQYVMGFVYVATILTFYASLVSKIQLILQRVNSRLIVVSQEIQNGRLGISQFSEIMKLIDIREELLFICFKNLSNVFGFVMFIVSVYVLIDLIQITFIVVIFLEIMKDLSFVGVWRRASSSIIWVSTEIVSYVLVFTCNYIQKEVSFDFYCRGFFLL